LRTDRSVNSLTTARPTKSKTLQSDCEANTSSERQREPEHISRAPKPDATDAQTHDRRPALWIRQPTLKLGAAAPAARAKPQGLPK
jgi:hypothetical protein